MSETVEELKERLARLEETDRNHIVGLTIAEGKVRDLTAKLEASENEKTTMTDRMLQIVNLCNRTKNNTSSWNAASAELAERILRVAKGEPETDSKKTKIPN